MPARNCGSAKWHPVTYRFRNCWKKNRVRSERFAGLSQRPHTIGSRPSDHYFRSVCLFVCLFVCAEFFSAVFNPISIKLGHMLYVWDMLYVCPLEYRGCATPGGWVTPKKLVFLGVLVLKKLSRPTVWLCWFLVILYNAPILKFSQAIFCNFHLEPKLWRYKWRNFRFCKSCRTAMRIAPPAVNHCSVAASFRGHFLRQTDLFTAPAAVGLSIIHEQSTWTLNTHTHQSHHHFIAVCACVSPAGNEMTRCIIKPLEQFGRYLTNYRLNKLLNLDYKTFVLLCICILAESSHSRSHRPF